MKKFLPVLTLIFLVSLVGFSTYKLNQKQRLTQELEQTYGVDDPDVTFAKVSISLPEFSLADLFDEDGSFSNQDLIGKFSVINFFASWCTTCKAEHEILLRLQSEGIVDIYGVAWRDIDDSTRNYLRAAGNPYKKVAKDGQGLFTRITGIQAVPETVIVDPKGRIVMRYRGNLQDFSIDEIRNFLKKQSH